MNLKNSIKKRVERFSLFLYKLFAPAPLHTYSHTISLGYNCEVAFQHLKYHGHLESHLFNWCYIYTTEALIQALQNLDTVGLDFNPIPPMWRDANFMINFHGKAAPAVWKQHDNAELLRQDKEDLKSRLAYLKTKLRNLAQAEGRILFILKPQLEELTSPKTMAASINNVYQSLADLGMKNFDLLVVVTSEHFQSIKTALSTSAIHSDIFIESIDYYAPVEAMTTGPYDTTNWRRIWTRYFSTYKPGKKKKLYKFDSH